MSDAAERGGSREQRVHEMRAPKLQVTLDVKSMIQRRAWRSVSIPSGAPFS